MADDITLGVSTRNLSNNQPLAKPSYLITLSDKTNKYFITTDRPEQLNGFIQAKGVFTDSKEEVIIKNYSAILTNASKEFILEMMFPWHKICSIRSLIFKAK
jgi:hypothetical protein